MLPKVVLNVKQDRARPVLVEKFSGIDRSSSQEDDAEGRVPAGVMYPGIEKGVTGDPASPLQPHTGGPGLQVCPAPAHRQPRLGVAQPPGRQVRQAALPASPGDDHLRGGGGVVRITSSDQQGWVRRMLRV